MGGNAGGQNNPGGAGAAGGVAGGGGGGGAASAGAAGSQAPSDWRGALTGEFESLRGEKALEVFKGKDWNEVGPALAKTVVHSQRLVGDSVRIPKPDAPPEEVAAFREKLGVPKDVSGYKDVKLPDVPGKQWDTGRIDAMVKPAFHKMGLTPQQAQDALGLFATYTQQQEKAALDGYFAGQDVLMDKWGLAFDGNVKLAYRTAEKFFPPNFMKLITASGIDAHPDFIQGLYTIGKNFAEDGIIDGDVPGAPTLDDLDKTITELRANIAKLPAGSKERDDAEKKLENAYKARYPEQAIRR